MEQITLSCPHCGFSKEIEHTRIPAGTNNIQCPKCKRSFSLESSFTFEPAPAEPRMSQGPEEFSVGTDKGRAGRALPQESSAESKFCSTCGEQIHIRAEICPACGVRVAPPANAVTKLALLLITFFLGGLGGHRFYQKKYWLGAVYLLFFWTYIPSLVAFVEFILYAFKSEAELQRRYPETSGRAVVFAVIVPMVGIALIGILAAIAIPQFASYRERSYEAAVVGDLALCKQQAEALFAERMSYPTQTADLHCQTAEGVSLFYLTQGFDEFQIIGYHARGGKAFLADADSAELAENSRQAIKLQLGQRYGDMPLEEGFHFME